MQLMKALEKTNNDRIIAGLIDSRNQIVRVGSDAGRTGGVGGLGKSKTPAGRRVHQNHRALLTAFCAGFPV